MTLSRFSLVAAMAAALPAQDPASSQPPAVAPDGQQPQVARAPQDQKPSRILVTASGFAEDELATPYTFQTLDQTTFEQRGYRTLPEALRDIPGVMVQKTTHGHGSPYIRGFTGRQNLVLIDGIRFNNSGFRSGPIQYWNTIDAYAMDELELIKSQGSVLYGSDAVGGTLNVRTKKADFRAEREGARFVHGMSLYRFDTNGQSHTGRVETQVGEGGSYGLHVGATGRDFGDIRDSELGTMEKTGYQEFDYDLRLDVALDLRTTFTAAHQAVRQDDVWRTHNTIYFEPWHGTSLTNPDLTRIYDQYRELSYARVAAEGLGGVVDGYSLTVSHQRSVEDFERTRQPNPNIRVQQDRTAIATLGAALQLESRVEEAVVTYGFDYYHDDVDSSSQTSTFDPAGALLSQTTAVQGPLGDNSAYGLFGAYAQGRVAVSDDVEVTLGGRYTQASADIGRLDDGAGNAISAARDFDDWTFNLRANWRVTDQTSVYGGASQAFRAPNLDDLSSLKPSRTGTIQVGALDVKPEEFVTYEVGARHVAEDLSLQTAAYYTDITDVITSRPVGTDPGTGEIITANTNGSDGWLAGGELQAAWQADRDWLLSGFVAYVDGEADTFLAGSTTPVREPISRLMPLTASMAARWTHPQGRWWVEGRGLAAAKEDRLNTADRADTSRFPPDGTPGYFVVMLSSGYRATDNLDFSLTLENVGDIDYRVHGSGVNQQGFNAILTGRVTF